MKAFYRTVADALKDSDGFKLADNLWSYEHNNFNVDRNDSEYKSWTKSLPILLKMIAGAGFAQNSICFEYPSIGLDGRMDAILIGKSSDGKDELIVFELKQWSYIGDASKHDVNAPTDVLVPIGNNQFDCRMHPLQQLRTYKNDLESNNSAVKQNDVVIRTVAFLHNCNDVMPLTSGRYNAWHKISELADNIYGANDTDRLSDNLRQWLSNDDNKPFVDQFVNAEYELTLADLSGLKVALSGKKNANMIQEQASVDYQVQKTMRRMKAEQENQILRKHMIIVSGQPGTGKTIVGLHFLFDYVNIFHNKVDVDAIINNSQSSYKASKQIFQKLRAVFTVPRSKTIHEVIDDKVKLSVPFLNNSGIPNGTNVLIVDEAHRIQDVNTDLTLAFNKANLVILLQDDRQTIKPSEAGTVSNFETFAKINQIECQRYQLTTQKRSGFQGNLVNAIDDLFYNYQADPLDDRLNVTTYSSPFELETLLKDDAKAHPEHRNKFIAAFDWPWNYSDHDIQIETNDGVFAKPWNPRHGSQAAWYWAKGVDSINSGEIDKVGCIYTAQGLEFDVVGFIWGKDFRWDNKINDWVVDPSFIQDKALRGEILSVNRDSAQNIMKNIYRILLTRATKKMGIYFEDEATRKHVSNSLNIQ